MKKEMVAMLLAGGQGSRLYALTSHVAKPAVPFGGKYRIIDFPLSNCVNSGIDTVGVLTQYQPLKLNSYLGNGQPWDLDRSDGGLHVLPPYVEKGDVGTWFKGTANAIYQNINFIDEYDPDYVLILSGDHIYKMDYAQMLAHHKAQQATATISVLEVTMEEATRFGIMNVDENDTIYEFEEKPAHPKSNLASMGIYIFTWSKLRQYLIDDENDPNSANDFGKNIIPAMLANGEKMSAYRFKGYWKDVGTIQSLWDANMDMLDVSNPNGIDVYDKEWQIFARNPIRPPPYHRQQRRHQGLPGHRRLQDLRRGGALGALPLGDGGEGRHREGLGDYAQHRHQGRRCGGPCHCGGKCGHQRGRPCGRSRAGRQQGRRRRRRGRGTQARRQHSIRHHVH